MVWSLALCPDDTKQDSVVYGVEFGLVFLAKGPRTASIQESLDCLRLNHSGLEGERDFRTRSTGERGRGCNKPVPVLGEYGTKKVPTRDIFDQPPGQMR